MGTVGQTVTQPPTPLGRGWLWSGWARSASLELQRFFNVTEDPPAKALQELGLAITPCDKTPGNELFVVSAREK